MAGTEDVAVASETVDLGPVSVTVARDAGPRILGYVRTGGPDLFARLPGAVIDHPAAGTFSFLGGHRLWRAPEVPAITYRPDDRPVSVERVPQGVRITGPAGPDAVVTVIDVRQEGELTVVDHLLRHEGERPVRCAAWAITQLAVGGEAVLPLGNRPADPDGVLPNRSVALWPYTDPAAPELEFRATELRVAGSGRPAKSKVGIQNRVGWLAYTLAGEVFVKWGPVHDDGQAYPDLGSSAECYRDERFVELETLGPLTDLRPGDQLAHREVWRLIPLDGAPLAEMLAALPADPLAAR